MIVQKYPFTSRSKTTKNDQVPNKSSLQIQVQDYQKWVYDELDTLKAGGKDIFRFITVPDDDQFGISDSLRGMTTAYSLTEIFSSHGYAYGEGSLLAKKNWLRVFAISLVVLMMGMIKILAIFL